MDPKAETGRDATVREPYEPPTAEDVDTTHAPSETSPALGGSPGAGVEESSRWH